MLLPFYIDYGIAHLLIMLQSFIFSGILLCSPLKINQNFRRAFMFRVDEQDKQETRMKQTASKAHGLGKCGI
jgi:hypothetical protein